MSRSSVLIPQSKRDAMTKVSSYSVVSSYFKLALEGFEFKLRAAVRAVRGILVSTLNIWIWCNCKSSVTNGFLPPKCVETDKESFIDLGFELDFVFSPDSDRIRRDRIAALCPYINDSGAM
jgi:hypothetical protein